VNSRERKIPFRWAYATSTLLFLPRDGGGRLLDACHEVSGGFFLERRDDA
jgi:hypothetical protein